jgi:CTP:phosphocholine cytidylyltransferase-like protein
MTYFRVKQYLRCKFFTTYITNKNKFKIFNVNLTTSQANDRLLTLFISENDIIMTQHFLKVENCNIKYERLFGTLMI